MNTKELSNTEIRKQLAEFVEAGRTQVWSQNDLACIEALTNECMSRREQFEDINTTTFSIDKTTGRYTKTPNANPVFDTMYTMLGVEFNSTEEGNSNLKTAVFIRKAMVSLYEFGKKTET